ncbi:hypothetical protein C1752_00184 [Acaryochloris thomasi RCC1774]|uniref:Transposase IS4-like domain-containing protein n=1 Tax=Acaryochloris thomasi RCC1774 TaxID=1764569 RepID=A0A2W1JYQ5_9CYAN|nr:ISAs1 family transposase [Acaryochloris thomasi]PZD75355.1 hypothetical protein C1752_00184 [Acaryochloris thomasi RCC1774]
MIALKANQPTLYTTLEQLHRSSPALSVVQTLDTSHNRQVHREVWAYAAPLALQVLWPGLETLLWVERWGCRNDEPFHEQMGYISDLNLAADEFMSHIQQHWTIENRLHWVRDVTLEEDEARPGGHAPTCWAILNCFLLSIIRQLGYRTIPQGIRCLANQVEKVYRILCQGFSLDK